MVDSGIILIKYWLEVGPDEQTRRLESRIDDPRKIWKLSDMDLKSYSRWFDYSRARDDMFAATDTAWAPWFVAHTDDKKRGRLNIISHLLSQVPYEPLPEVEDHPADATGRPVTTGTPTSRCITSRHRSERLGAANSTSAGPTRDAAPCGNGPMVARRQSAGHRREGLPPLRVPRIRPAVQPRVEDPTGLRPALGGHQRVQQGVLEHLALSCGAAKRFGTSR